MLEPENHPTLPSCRVRRPSGAQDRRRVAPEAAAARPSCPAGAQQSQHGHCPQLLPQVSWTKTQKLPVLLILVHLYILLYVVCSGVFHPKKTPNNSMSLVYPWVFCLPFMYCDDDTVMEVGS